MEKKSETMRRKTCWYTSVNRRFLCGFSLFSHFITNEMQYTRHHRAMELLIGLDLDVCNSFQHSFFAIFSLDYFIFFAISNKKVFSAKKQRWRLRFSPKSRLLSMLTTAWWVAMRIILHSYYFVFFFFA